MASGPRVDLVLTCEHGGNTIPRPWRALFAGAGEVLASHRGWDPGALPLARTLARKCGAPLFHSTVSRLLVDLNRSPRHPRVFSAEWTKPLARAERECIMELHYHPHRDAVTAAIRARIDAGARVLHVSVHSFTPVFNGEVRDVDIGVLYDPRRQCERGLGRAWLAELQSADGDLRHRANQPYKGSADGFTTALRRAFPSGSYAGVELELNHGPWFDDRARWNRQSRAVHASLGALLARAPRVWDDSATG